MSRVYGPRTTEHRTYYSYDHNPGHVSRRSSALLIVHPLYWWHVAWVFSSDSGFTVSYTWVMHTKSRLVVGMPVEWVTHYYSNSSINKLSDNYNLPFLSSFLSIAGTLHIYMYMYAYSVWNIMYKHSQDFAYISQHTILYFLQLNLKDQPQWNFAAHWTVALSRNQSTYNTNCKNPI